MAVFDLLAVVIDDDVTPFDSCFLGRAVSYYIGNKSAVLLRNFQCLGKFGGNRLDIDSQVAAGDFPVFHQLRNERFGGIDRNCKTDSLALGNDGGVDANHLALHIEQWAA